MAAEMNQTTFPTINTINSTVIIADKLSDYVYDASKMMDYYEWVYILMSIIILFGIPTYCLVYHFKKQTEKKMVIMILSIIVYAFLFIILPVFWTLVWPEIIAHYDFEKVEMVVLERRDNSYRCASFGSNTRNSLCYFPRIVVEFYEKYTHQFVETMIWYSGNGDTSSENNMNNFYMKYGDRFLGCYDPRDYNIVSLCTFSNGPLISVAFFGILTFIMMAVCAIYTYRHYFLLRRNQQEQEERRRQQEELERAENNNL